MTDIFEDSAYEDAPNRMPQTTQVSMSMHGTGACYKQNSLLLVLVVIVYGLSWCRGLIVYHCICESSHVVKQVCPHANTRPPKVYMCTHRYMYI